MQKIVTKEINTFSPSGVTPAGATNVLIRKVRRSIAVALATVAGCYFVALSILVVILILPVFLLRALKERLSAGS